MTFENLTHFKSIVVHDFFVRPADENYLLARWMLINGFAPECFWQASQAIEKYLKAILLANDLDIRKYDHRVLKLYEKHLDICGTLAMSGFTRPYGLDESRWLDESVPHFIEWLCVKGEPDSRYGLRSWWRGPDDIFKLDQLVQRLRRLTLGLEWQMDLQQGIFPESIGPSSLSFREVLAQQPLFDLRGPFTDLDYRIHSTGETRADLLHAWNFAFLREDRDLTKAAPHLVSPLIGPARNSRGYLLHQHMMNVAALDIAGAKERFSPVVAEGMRWLLDRIKLSTADSAKFERVLQSYNSTGCP